MINRQNLFGFIMAYATVMALVYFGVYAVVLGVKRIADYEPPTYAPIEQSAIAWGHEHLGSSITVVCEDQTCIVWSTYYGGRSSHTSPPILLDCSTVCIPNLQHSVTIQKEHTQ